MDETQKYIETMSKATTKLVEDGNHKGKKSSKRVKKKQNSVKNVVSNVNNNDNNNDNSLWSKSKKKRMRKLKAKQMMKEQYNGNSNGKSKVINAPHHSDSGKIDSKSSENEKKTKNALIEQYKNKLSGGRFRELNELLYTSNSKDAFSKFSSEPILFEQYHVGFRNQIQSWPVNPVDVICKWLLKLSTQKDGVKITVADFGCGDAKLGRQLINYNLKRKKNFFDVHSFDLVAPKNENQELVTSCDMANVPLKAKTIDVAVFSLALMGTNIEDFIREAHRVLRVGGILKIAEVRSRFETSSTHSQDENELVSKKIKRKKKVKKSVGKNSSLLDEFLNAMELLGFEMINIDNRTNKLFFLVEFKRLDKKPDPNVTFTAKACLYKRR